MAASLYLSLDTLLSSHRFPSLSSPKPRRHHHHHHFPIKSLHPSSSTAPFLDPISLHRLHTLNTFNLSQDFHGGSLRIRPMAPEEINPAVALLAESFAESMWLPAGYVKLLEFLVRQYVVERRNLVPHSVILVGLYKEENMEAEEGGAHLACAAEVSFDARGANAAPPTPTPPRNCPYICNMTVKKTLRRRGIGRQLLNACEELISQMKTIRKVYLHCRVIDTIPFQMYKKAGYSTVQTDSFLIWLTLQRRKHLMCKELPPLAVDFQQDNSDSEVIHSDKLKDQWPEAAG